MPQNRTRPRIALVLTSLVLALPLTSASAADMLFDDDDRTATVTALESSLVRVLAEVEGLSSAQITYRPEPGRWSVGEIVEHLVLAEALIFGQVEDQVLPSQPRTPEEMARYPAVTDAAIALAVTNRQQRFNAPQPIQPAESGYETAEAAAEAFTEARAKALAFARTTQVDLRSHFAPHVVFGSLDGAQWLLFIAAHTERHLEQIREVKASTGFPGS